IFSKYGDYKFPGGGVEFGEELQDALIREVKEETGYQVIKTSVTRYGKVLERRKGAYEDILEMESNYFLCEVNSEVGSRNLDEYEAEYDYQIVWMTLSDAIERNMKIVDLDTCPWVIRDTKVMEYLLDEKLRNNKLILDNVLTKIPEDMRTLIEGHSFIVDNIGCSGSHIFVFDNDLVLKVENKRAVSDGEYQMMEWLQDKLPVPRIINFYTDGGKNYLLMTKINGRMACDPNVMKDSKNMVRLLANGLKSLWEVDIKDCPRTINLDFKLKSAIERIKNNEIDMEEAEPGTFGTNGFKSPLELYEYLKENRPTEEPVLIHGDYCLPNVFFNENEVAGFIDLGFCGVGDKWQDIAMAVRSLNHNLTDIKKKEELLMLQNILFNELGITANEEKIRYYILLDELF
ncbi:MAG: aminoglycoside phosphotransferase, partial [Anaerocolumna sp.]|nr:aminoglycoside phosphotransferase [Anaerocolumna sp.]